MDQPTRVSEAQKIEGFRIRLHSILDGNHFVPFEQAWEEFNKRCAKSPIKSHLIMNDLIFDIESGRWPKKK